MVLEAKRLSLWDTARLQAAVSLPAMVWGVVAPNRLGVALLCWLDAGRAPLRLFADFRRKYRCGHLWTWLPVWALFPLRSTLLVLDPESMDAVLRSNHSAPDPSLKKRALSRFAPEGLIISSGEHWEARRRFNEDVLGFDGLHRDGDAFRTIALEEVERLNVQPGGALRWPDFQSLGERISQQVILGAHRHEPEMAAQLAKMVGWSNLLLRHRRSFSAFYRTTAHYLSGALGAERGASVHDVAPHCLVHRSAALLASGAATSATHVPSQVGFWAFVLKDALELHVARTLALIASHPEVQSRVRREIRSVPALTAESIDGLRYLDSCLREQLRLWTPVPLLLRRADNDLVLRDAIPVKAEQQLLIHAGVYHRDSEVFGDVADRFSPDSADAYPLPVLFFSRHQRSCAGQFLARFLIKATLASLLARFEFKLVNPPIDRQRVSYLYNHFKIELQASSSP
jgi:cytochrome P450